MGANLLSLKYGLTRYHSCRASQPLGSLAGVVVGNMPTTPSFIVHVQVYHGSRGASSLSVYIHSLGSRVYSKSFRGPGHEAASWFRGSWKSEL